MKRIILIVLSLILFLLVGTVLYVLTFDINSYKGRIEQKLSEALGKQVFVRGKISMHKSFTPVVYLSDIEIESPRDFEQPLLMKVKQLGFSLNLVPLFQKRLEVTDVNLDDVSLFLEVNKDGEKNWAVKKKEEVVVEKASRPLPIRPQTSVEEDEEVVIKVDRINLNRVNVSYEDFQTNTKETLFFGNLSLRQLVNFDGNGEYKGEKFSMRGTVQDLLNVINTQKNFRLSFDLDAYDMKLKTSAAIPDLNSLDSVTINVQAEGSDLRKTLSSFMKDVSFIPNAPFETQAALRIEPGQRIVEGTASISKDAEDKENKAFTSTFSAEIKDDFAQIDGRLSFDLKDEELAKVYGIKPVNFVSIVSLENKNKLVFQNFSLISGETDIDGTLSFDFSKEIPDISGAVNSRFLKISDLLASNDVEKYGAQGAADEKAADLRLFSDKNIDFSFLDKYTAQLELNVSNLFVGNVLSDYPKILSNISLKDKKLNVTLNEGSLFAGAPVVGYFRISKNEQGVPEDSLFLIGEKAQVRQLNVLSSHAKDGTLDLNVDLKTKGFSPREMASNLNGKFLLIANESTLISPFVDDLQLLSKAGDGKMISQAGYLLNSGLFLKTAVFNLNVNKGIINLDKRVAMETNRVNIVLDGTIDLGTEKLNIELIPSSNRNKVSDIAQMASKMILIQGTILDPKISSTPVRLVKEMALSALSGEGIVPKKTDDVSPAKKAMAGSKFKTIDDYFGRNRKEVVVVKETPKVVEETKTEGQKRIEQFRRDLLNSITDVLQSTSEEEEKSSDKKKSTKTKARSK